MATFTWNSTTGSTWEDTSAIGWNGSPAFLASPGDSFVIDGTAAFTIDGIGSNNDEQDNANTVTVNDPNVTLLMDSPSGPQFDINTSLVLNAGTLNLGGSGELSLGDNSGNGGAPGTITLGASAVITDTGPGASAFIFNYGGSDSTIQGAGTILATGGALQIEYGMDVAAGDTTNFQIANGAELDLDGLVGGGFVSFLGSSGVLGLGQVVAGAFAGGNAITGMTPNSGAELSVNDGDPLSFGFVGNGSTGSLTITDSGVTETITLSGNYTGDVLSVNNNGDPTGGNGYSVSVVCYAAGTAILTEVGEVPVESLQRGDTVMTLAAGRYVPRTVTWAGHRDIDLIRHPNPTAVAPIRFGRGALGENLPHRDLILSPDHCLFIDGGLYPAKLLVNDMTIVRDLTANTVAYHHIELERHEVMIAEGVAAESYLDTGNRAFFSNGGLATILYPELNINENLRCWATDACAPLTVKPEAVKPVWQRFADRATALGHTAPDYATTQDAGIHLIVDGKIVRPLAACDATVSFMLPAKARWVRLVSRSTRPSALTPWLDDPRDLGIAIRSVTLRDQTGQAVMDADHPALRVGWHAAECGPDGAPWRWTAGDAVLPIEASGACMLEIALSATATYIVTAAYVEDTNRLAA